MKTKTVEEVIRRFKRGDKDFQGVTIKQGDFSKMRLVGINFEGAILIDCNFEKSILQNARFSAANLRGANLRGANLAKADLKGVDFRGAVMRAVDLRGADLRWANLEGVNLSGSIIASANFDGANLKSASLKNTDPGKWWWKANLDEARLEDTILPNGTVFSQPETDRRNRRSLDSPSDQEAPAAPAGPDYERADRLYYEALGVIASIQTQTQAGTPLNHPRIKALMKEAAAKFSDAVTVSDANWPHHDKCAQYAANLLLDMEEDTLRDWQL
jgi:uncharacterized protein YjbI with pentapeptide repeats